MRNTVPDLDKATALISTRNHKSVLQPKSSISSPEHSDILTKSNSTYCYH